MTYPAPPPELPPSTTPQVAVQAPEAVSRPEPVAPAPLRQVIEQLPPATAQDLGRPMGVVDVSTVREAVQPASPQVQPATPATSQGDRTTPSTVAPSPAAPALPDSPAAKSQQLNGNNATPSLPPLSNPVTGTAPNPTASGATTAPEPTAKSTTAAPSKNRAARQPIRRSQLV